MGTPHWDWVATHVHSMNYSYIRITYVFVYVREMKSFFGFFFFKKFCLIKIMFSVFFKEQLLQHCIHVILSVVDFRTLWKDILNFMWLILFSIEHVQWISSIFIHPSILSSNHCALFYGFVILNRCMPKRMGKIWIFCSFELTIKIYTFTILWSCIETTATGNDSNEDCPSIFLYAFDVLRCEMDWNRFVYGWIFKWIF